MSFPDNSYKSSRFSSSVIELGYAKRRRNGHSYEYRWVAGKPTEEMAILTINKATINRRKEDKNNIINQHKIDFTRRTSIRNEKQNEDTFEFINKNTTYVSILWGLIKIKKG